MTRETIVRILEQAPGVEGTGTEFTIGEGHRLTLYLGRPGQAMEVRDVTTLRFNDGFVAADTREAGTFYLADDTVHGVSVGPARGKAGRAGF